MTNIYESFLVPKLKLVDKQFRDVIKNIPKLGPPNPHPYWFHNELIERYLVIKNLNIQPGMAILEIGSGSDALSTIVLAHFVGETGCVVAVDRARWSRFENRIDTVPYKNRIIPLKLDATNLPFPYSTFDIAVMIHAVRSMGENKNLIQVLKEMKRFAPKIVLAESLPIAHNPAQQAHLDMYNLREPVFNLIFEEKDDLHYRSEANLLDIMDKIGVSNIHSQVIEFDLPHFLAPFAKEFIMRIEDLSLRKKYLRKFEKASKNIQTFGEAHPPVCLITAKSS